MADAVKILSDKKDKKIKSICFELFKVKQQEQEVKQKYAEIQQKVKEYFRNKDEKTIQFSVGNKSYKITDVNPQKIVWDIEKLLKRFKTKKIEKEIVNQIVKKTYTINDWDKFTDLLSEHGMTPTEVLPLISVDKKVDQKKMNELSEVGDITDDDVKGCYTLEEITGSLRTSEWENADEQ